MNGPLDLKLFKNKYFVIGGAIKDNTYDTVYPRGCLLVIDKNNISTVLTTSIKIDRGLGASIAKIYDYDVSEDSNVVISLISIGAVVSEVGLVWGMAGDGHHNEIYKHSFSEANGSLTKTGGFTWNVGYMDTCDTLDLFGNFFYLSCGFWLPNASDGSLPLVAKFNLATMAYSYSYYMGFDLA